MFVSFRGQSVPQNICFLCLTLYLKFVIQRCVCWCHSSNNAGRIDDKALAFDCLIEKRNSNLTNCYISWERKPQTLSENRCPISTCLCTLYDILTWPSDVSPKLRSMTFGNEQNTCRHICTSWSFSIALTHDLFRRFHGWTYVLEFSENRCFFQYENEVSFMSKWCTTGPLMTRPHFSDSSGRIEVNKDAMKVPEGWRWDGDWQLAPELSLFYDRDAGLTTFLEDVFVNEMRVPGKTRRVSIIPALRSYFCEFFKSYDFFWIILCHKKHFNSIYHQKSFLI